MGRCVGMLISNDDSFKTTDPRIQLTAEEEKLRVANEAKKQDRIAKSFTAMRARALKVTGSKRTEQMIEDLVDAG